MRSHPSRRPVQHTRRSALVAAAGMLTTTLTVGYFRWGGPQAREHDAPIEAAQQSLVPPWSVLPPSQAAWFEAVEHWVANLEARGLHGLVADEISKLMSTPLTSQGPELLTKQDALFFVTSTRRHYYLPFMVGLLSPSAGDEQLCAQLINELKFQAEIGELKLSAEARASLQRYRDDSSRCTPLQRQLIDRALALR